MRAILVVIDYALQLYMWIVIDSAVFSWLYTFNVVNPRNPIVTAIGQFLYQVTEPVLRPIRRFMPNLGSIDVSPVVLLLMIILLREVIRRYIYPYVF